MTFYHENQETISRSRHRKPSFLAVDFFCGAGGITRGLLDAGGHVIAGIDKDKNCRDTYIRNNINPDGGTPTFLESDIFPKTAVYRAGQQGELFQRLEELVTKARRKWTRIPLLFAICAPCQPFTGLSKKALSNEREKGRRRDKNLLREATRFVDRFRPELILSENVQGIGDPKYGGVWAEFRESLSRLHYVTGSQVVCASRFGIPQYRKRSILIAVRKDVVNKDRLADLAGEFLLTPEYDPEAALVSVGEAIGHLPPLRAGESHPHVPNHIARSLSPLNYRRLAAASPGESNAYMEATPDGDLTLQCHRNLINRTGKRCFSDVYTRMHPNRPSPTITTRCNSISNGRYGHFDRTQVRGISLREAATLQSFPETYVFYDSRQDCMARMIGNAVPPKLAEFYSRYLLRSTVTSVNGSPFSRKSDQFL